MKNITLQLSPDKSKAYLTIQERFDHFPSLEQLIRFLKESGIRYGLDTDQLELIADNRQPVNKILIADINFELNVPESLLDWQIALNRPHRPEIDSANRADFKKISLYEPVRENQVLIRKRKSTEPVVIKNVLGEETKIILSDVPFPVGNNVHVSVDSNELLASRDGFAVLEGGLLHVNDIFHVHGDVNYATGNIKCTGPVVIEGDVRSGFRVESTSSIYIGGTVEAAHIFSQYGDITVQFGIVGHGRAKILAGGGLTCGFIQEATVSVRKNVVISHYSINSQISAGGQVILKGNEAIIRGGSVTTEKGILANQIGSEHRTFTELKIRSFTENESQSKIWEISRKRSDINIRLSSIKKRLEFLEVLRKRLGSLSPGKDKEIDFLQNEKNRLQQSMEELAKTETSLQQEAAKEQIRKEIVVQKKLFPNVSIDIGGVGVVIDQVFEGVKVSRLKNEILFETLLDMDDSAYDIFIPGSDNSTQSGG